MENQFKNLNTDFEHKDSVVVFPYPNSMFKLGEFMKATKEAFMYQGLDELGKKLSNRGGVPIWREIKASWFKDGVECEILKINGNGWQKGKLRLKISLEFCPDEPEIEQTPEITPSESPLDDIRRRINEASA